MSESTSITITAAEWTEIEPNGTEIVLQNEGCKSIRLVFGDTEPSGAWPTIGGLLLQPQGDPMTFALEAGDSVWARVYSGHDVMKCRLNVWQEAAA